MKYKNPIPAWIIRDKRPRFQRRPLPQTMEGLLSEWFPLAYPASEEYVITTEEAQRLTDEDKPGPQDHR